MLVPLFSGALAADKPGPATVPWTIDFRYAPPNWQTSICLPDDWQKTLLGKDGGLLYDYPGKHAGFGTRITASLAGGATWLRQELVSPRVPIVRTTKRADKVELVEEAFAVAPPLGPAKKGKRHGLILERVGSQTGQANWASPPKSADPAFRNAAIGWVQPVQYRFKAPKRERYTVVFGLCEGHHQQPGQRIVNLLIEGKTRRTVDLVAEKGRNVPQLFSFEAQDDNGDGWIDLAVAAAEKSPDANTILNVLWVFRAQDKPSLAELLSGQSTPPALAHLDCGADQMAGKTPRHDLLFVHLRNPGATEAKVSPILTIESEYPITPQPDQRRVLIGAGTSLLFSQKVERWEQSEGRLVLQFVEVSIAPGGEKELAVGVARGPDASDWSIDAVQAAAFRKRAEQFWQNLDLPYGHLQVPDSGVQALLDSCVRNIYQAREIKKDLPVFQVGPTCYRGLWVVDGSFIMEAVAYLGRVAEARNGIKYLLSFQREDGGVMLIDGHWKETGIALWAVTRHARLTGDKAWLRDVWPKVERGFAYIHKMREMASADPKAPNAGLIPDGFSDGGLADKVPEYTNIYWTMAGMRAAVEAARWLGRPQQADDWQQEYDDLCQTFRRAAERDTRTDARGNRYLPIRMRDDGKIPPQKAQWAFLHAVFPGKVFAANDPLVQGNMAMLQSVEAQGLVLDTGWLKDGIWNYFASFYGHAWLWLGSGGKAAETLYAFGNHASPLLVWREEQMPVGQGEQVVGDMPHNWASAEFIRLVRHSLILERGGELHLFEAFPPAWAKPGAVTKVKDILTEFGPVSLEFRVSADGATGRLHLSPPARTRPKRIVLHLEPWSAQTGTIDLPVKGKIEERIKLNTTATLPDP
ncbi:MAG: hypothetical protein AAB676_13870 [Verrucomicrobiota bacterium]